MSLLESRIKAIEFWQNNGHTSPRCNFCDNTIVWGNGFILDDSSFSCKQCIQTIKVNKFNKTIGSLFEGLIRSEKLLINRLNTVVTKCSISFLNLSFMLPKNN